MKKTDVLLLRKIRRTTVQDKGVSSQVSTVDSTVETTVVPTVVPTVPTVVPTVPTVETSKPKKTNEPVLQKSNKIPVKKTEPKKVSKNVENPPTEPKKAESKKKIKKTKGKKNDKVLKKGSGSDKDIIDIKNNLKLASDMLEKVENL